MSIYEVVTFELIKYEEVPVKPAFSLPQLVDPTQTQDISRQLAKFINDMIKQMAREMLEALTAEAKIKIDQTQLDRETVELQITNLLRRINSAVTNIRNSLGPAARNLISNVVSKVYVKASSRTEKDLKRAGVMDKQDNIPGSLIDDKIGATIEDTINDLIETLQTQFATTAKNVIRTGLLRGEPIGVIREKLRAETKKAVNSVNRTVRTEMVRTFNIASATKFRQTGVEYVLWQASRSPKSKSGLAPHVCEHCNKLHNTVVPIGQAFAVINGREIKMPPDPHPNCLCRLVPVTIEQLAGMSGLSITDTKIRRLVREFASRST